MKSTALVNSLRPIICIARYTGQLPVIWDPRRGWWCIADWYHPQFLYFLSVLLLRMLSYCAMSFVNIASQFNFNGTSSMSTSYFAEISYFWLRLVLAPYALVLNLRTLNGALEKLQEADSIIGTKIDTDKPRRLTLILATVTALTIPLLLYTQWGYAKWYSGFLHNYALARLVVTLNGLDIMMETLVTIEFSLASLLLQLRLASLRQQLKQVADSQQFCMKVETNSELSPEHHNNVASIHKLHHAYTLLCQVAKDTATSLGWPVLFLSLGDVFLLMFNSYILIRYQYFLISSSLIADLAFYAMLLLIFHAIFALSTLFYFGDRTTEELELQSLANSPRFRNPTLRNEIQHFYIDLSLFPPQKISAAGFYSIGKTTVPAVLGVVITYFVVLIQFDLSSPPQPNVLKSNTTCG